MMIVALQSNAPDAVSHHRYSSFGSLFELISVCKLGIDSPCQNSELFVHNEVFSIPKEANAVLFEYIEIYYNSGNTVFCKWLVKP